MSIVDRGTSTRHIVVGLGRVVCVGLHHVAPGPLTDVLPLFWVELFNRHVSRRVVGCDHRCGVYNRGT